MANLTFSSYVLFIAIVMFSSPSEAASASRTIEVVEDDSPSLNLTNFSGEIRISTGEPGKIEIRYEQTDERIPVSIENYQNGSIVRVNADREAAEKFGNSPIDFNVEIPPNGNLFVSNSFGLISVSGTTGKVGLTSVAANIELMSASGIINIKSVSGDLLIDGIREADLHADTVSGKIDFKNGDFSGISYKFESINGDISLDHITGAEYFLSAVTTTGEILNNIGNETLNAKTVASSPAIDMSEFGHKFLRLEDPLRGGARLFGGFNEGEVTVDVMSVIGNIVLNSDR